MRLLLKTTLAIMVLHGIGLGTIISQQQWFSSRVQDFLAIEENCGNDCWFGLQYGGSTHFSDDRTKVQDQDSFIFRHSKMRFRVLEDNQGPALGFVEISIEENYAATACFLPNQVPGKTITLGDIIASFGSPDYFWIDLGSVQSMLRSNQILIDYEMIYESPSISVQGQIRTTDLDNRLPIDTPVELMCTPPVSSSDPNNQTRPLYQFLPAWNGFNERISSYSPQFYFEEDVNPPVFGPVR
jgi:hypothetical protein